jgi:hypothetical protein
MKKSLLILVAAVLTTMFATAQVTDTIVSTTPSNRNVVLEEYTGINCTWCPAGHLIANQIKEANPDRVFLINIHQGGYASNTYTTQFGDALANQTNLEGYPSGTVNRHVFSGSATAMGRGEWTSASNTIMNMSSPVNIAAEGTLDWATRTLSIRVQLYYTSSQNVSSNALNIAITQDNVLGAQVGKEKNPAQVIGNQYNHMHMLRHLITGQWGETINTISAGTLVERTYEYVIPQQLGSPNAIDAVLEDLHFIAFVCEGHQEILTGIEIPVQHTNMPAIGGRLVSLNQVESFTCNDQGQIFMNFKNTGSNNVTTLDYTYTVNGTSTTATWTGNIAPMTVESVTLPAFDITLNTNNTVTVQVTAINGESVNIDSRSLTLKKNVYSGGGNMTFIIKTDNYGSETSFKFFDPNGNVVLSGGPFNNASVEHSYTFSPAFADCYHLEVYDAYGDGINAGYGAGYFQLLAEDGSQIFKDNGKFGSQATYMINVLYPAGIEDVTVETSIYPNPATDHITISTTDNVQRVEIYNMQGQLVKAETGAVNNISVKGLANGMYTLKLTTDNGVSVHKIVKK